MAGDQTPTPTVVPVFMALMAAGLTAWTSAALAQTTADLAPSGAPVAETSQSAAPSSTSPSSLSSTSASPAATSSGASSAPNVSAVSGASGAPGLVYVPSPVPNATGPAVSAAPPPTAPTHEDADAPTEVRAERMTGRPDREVMVERQVEITRGQTHVEADRATYDIVNDKIDAQGNIRMQRPGVQYTGDDLDLKMDTGIGHVDNPTYRLDLNKAQGKADRINFTGQDQANVEHGTYSTCEAPDPDWYLRASTLDIDRGTNIGNASDAVVIFKGVPILASPYLSFPLSDARKSGVLPPTIGTTSKGGLEFTVPYYFNIAPNRDLTLYPKVITRRGLQLGADARYLGAGYSGETKIEAMPGDRLYGASRYALTSVHTQTLAPGLTFNSSLNYASDDSYPNDFPGTITAASQRLLPNDVSLTYAASPDWNLTAHASKYEVLQDPAAPIAQPYDRLPQITFNAGKTLDNGLAWSFNSDATRFWNPDMVRGDRFVVNPRISYPIVKAGYFFTPSFSVHAATYNLTGQAAGTSDHLSLVVPTLSVDSGLVFERDAHLFGRDGTQTLEPRLFYVYTPFKDQSQIPNFDTGIADFNFSQIFAENRFIGNDRVSDANQITGAVTSRFFDNDGVELMRLALAQRFYFNDQLVVNGARETKSDLLGEASGQIARGLSLTTSAQYSQSLHTFERAVYGVRYQPGPKKVLNLEYRKDVPTALRLIDASGQWPIGGRWYAVGRVNYSLQERKLAEGVGGVEYKADCWVFRAVVQRIPTAAGVVNSALYFQLELSGLAKIGSNPLQLLRTYVPGYQPVNTP